MAPKSKPPAKKGDTRSPTPAVRPPNVNVYFDVAVDGAELGRIEFQLLTETCPRTVENFKVLCTGPAPPEKGAKGKPIVTNVYQGSRVHRVTNYMIQGGDLSKERDGKGQESMYGPTFEDENFDVPFDRPGILCMANSGPDTNGSQFCITTKATPWLHKRVVAFGRVTAGMDHVLKIQELAMPDADPETGSPAQQIVVTECGVVPASPKSPL